MAYHSIARKLLIALALFLGNSAAHKQQHYSLDELDEELHRSHYEQAVDEHRLLTGVERCRTASPTLAEKWQDEQNAMTWRESQGCTSESCPPLEVMPEQSILVYWHIIRRSGGSGGLTSDQITSALSVLNKAFWSTGFSFTLAGTDTTNNDRYYAATNGSSDEASMKAALHKGNAETLNVYSLGYNSALGWAQLPRNYASDPSGDGVVIYEATVPGTPVTASSEGYNEGDTLVHEVGHWLGLLHVWEGGCMSSTGDLVDDTPPQDEPSEGCPIGKDTCCGDGWDSYHNYMDYSNDACMFQFTWGQQTRMKEQWNLYRAGGGRVGPTEEFSLTKTALNAWSRAISLFNGP